EESCFCGGFGINPFFIKNSDISLYIIDEEFLVDINTQEGENLVNNHLDLFINPDDKDFTYYSKLMNIFNRNKELFDLVELNKKFKKSSNNRIWTEISDICLGCATCSFLCPVCHCFDVFDEGSLEKGERIRVWDFCLSKDFTRMASGEDPFPERKDKIKHRFFHKFVYMPERYGYSGCTGCGRCIKYCPVKIDIRKILSEIND
ncbi:hypothetical protein DRQ09_09850, partial [candidate division KSB1 bacterium]